MGPPTASALAAAPCTSQDCAVIGGIPARGGSLLVRLTPPAAPGPAHTWASTSRGPQPALASLEEGDEGLQEARPGQAHCNSAGAAPPSAWSANGALLGWVPARNRSDAAAGARVLATARGLTAPVGGCHPAFPVVAAEGKARFRPWLERTRHQCFVARRRRLGQLPRRSTPLSPGSSGEWSGFKSSRAATWGCRFAMRP